MSADIHPCLTCGVCCPNYRVEFSIYELQSMGGTVPDEMAHEVHNNGNRARMNDTDKFPVRCDALTELPHLGEACIGCGIYEPRSGPCRDSPFASYSCHGTPPKSGLPSLTAEHVERSTDAARLTEATHV